MSVIATSSAAGAAYVKQGYSNLRVGMLLEVGTTLGAVGDAALATVLLVSAYLSLWKMGEAEPRMPPDALAARLRLDSSYPTPKGSARIT